MNQSRVMAYLIIFFGITCLIPLFYPGVDRLILKDAQSLFARYFLVITSLNAAVFFIVGGFLFYKGVLISHYSSEAGHRDRTKIEISSIIASTPFIISASVTIYEMSTSYLWKIMWGLVLLYIFAIFLHGIKKTTIFRKTNL